MRKKIKWFARGGGILKAGPFNNQIEATKSMIILNHCDNPICPCKTVAPTFPDNVFVWPEEV